MCGITGVYTLKNEKAIEQQTIEAMAAAIVHRGPDDTACIIEGRAGLGFKRLSIIDLATGQQPFYSPDGSVVLICNGEIFNYKELRRELTAKGHQFRSACDVEVILYLYLEHGPELLSRLNGQFAFAIYDKRENRLMLARDHFGICPLFYTVADDLLIFGSEIKSIFQHPAVARQIDCEGLDQILSFPANISPTTMFKGISSLPPGNFMLVRDGNIRVESYWDLDYPDECEEKPESYYVERLEELLLQSVKYRLNADVPLGFYLSGGLDSSLIGAMMRRVNPSAEFHSISIGFPGSLNEDIDESRYQKILARHIGSQHHEIRFDWSEISSRLDQAVYHAEGPLKETYNTCSLALSAGLKSKNIKVTLCGEGSDELFGGYYGYKFDYHRRAANGQVKDMDDLLAEQERARIWGDPDLIYELDHYAFKDTKEALYSARLNERIREFDCLEKLPIDRKKIVNKHFFNQRSYLDFKIRLAGHLIADHGDRMTAANSIEGRYPFLDINLVEFVKTIPPGVKLKGMVEKYILKKVSEKYVPREIVDRQKFAFVAPGSPQLLKNKCEWAQDLLSYETIKRQGFFNPDTVERLKKLYASDSFHLNAPYESDLILIVLTFGLLLEKFRISLN